MMAEIHADASKHIKVYLAVFAALAVFTVVTVAASLLDVSRPLAVAIALGIASVKASLVAFFFMHLKSEKAALLWMVLLLTAVFFLVLIALPSLTAGDVPPGVKRGTWG